MPIPPGRRLGPHEILSAIGAGGMGKVYKARDTRLDRIVAIKVLPTHLADRSELRERFDCEAKTIAGLNHPDICTLYDTGPQADIDFLVTRSRSASRKAHCRSNKYCSMPSNFATFGRALRPIARNLWRVLSYRLLHDRLTEGCAIAFRRSSLECSAFGRDDGAHIFWVQK
jgi:serine/threonine protein kinase